MDLRKCKHCGVTFDLPGRSFSNHVRWCDKNPAPKDQNKVCGERAAASRFGLLKEFVVQCHKCGTSLIVREREKSFPKKDRYYCSRRCANSHFVSDETKQKIADGVRKLIGPREERKQVCVGCNKVFIIGKKKDQVYCTKECYDDCRKTTDEFLHYKKKCAFRFNVYNFPDEFDLDLISKHGWYKAKNRGDNLGGVSRDHKISIVFGWKNYISPEIMRHPANCQLMIHSDNISKLDSCSINLEELKEGIREWNEKYKGA